MSQDEYFSVRAAIRINVEPLQDSQAQPDADAFMAEIPAPFRVASQCGQVDNAVEKELQSLDPDDASALYRILQAQNEKITLMMGYMLSQEDDPSQRFTTHTFGASSFAYLSPAPLKHGDHARVKLFLDFPPTAIYCYGVVTHCEEKAPDGDHPPQYLIQIQYTRLLEDDRDTLIRAALHHQQKLLRKRALNRKKSSS
ncbi:PilZ domain-containing protein [Salinivibrio costicola]|uniref:PilZ domain-containing protein n=1 Tax=Salinivibrio costicola TaxID=51367 RepID=A0ABX6K3X2_SALCS|nr:PilZ domain-containing protein [Salinivibrio costicola]QIR06253.1 PilZ domain-containing protein [Salinivibrio costicola]